MPPVNLKVQRSRQVVKPSMKQCLTFSLSSGNFGLANTTSDFAEEKYGFKVKLPLLEFIAYPVLKL